MGLTSKSNEKKRNTQDKNNDLEEFDVIWRGNVGFFERKFRCLGDVNFFYTTCTAFKT